MVLTNVRSRRTDIHFKTTTGHNVQDAFGRHVSDT